MKIGEQLQHHLPPSIMLQSSLHITAKEQGSRIIPQNSPKHIISKIMRLRSNSYNLCSQYSPKLGKTDKRTNIPCNQNLQAVIRTHQNISIQRKRSRIYQQRRRQKKKPNAVDARKHECTQQKLRHDLLKYITYNKY